MGFIRNSKNQKVKNAVKVIDNLRNGPRRLDRASNDIDEILTDENIDDSQVTSVLGKIEDRINNEPTPATHLTTQVIDVALSDNDVMGQYTKLVNIDDDENKFNIEKSTIAENLYDRTHCNSNYETYVNCNDYTSDLTVRGDYSYKGKTNGDYSFEYSTTGNYDYISITEGDVNHLYETKGNLKKEYKRGKNLDYSLNISENSEDKLLIGGDAVIDHKCNGEAIISHETKGNVKEKTIRGKNLDYSLNISENSEDKLLIGGDAVIDHKCNGEAIINHETKGNVKENTIRGKNLDYSLNVSDNYEDKLLVGGNYEKRSEIEGDEMMVCDVKGSVVENLNRGVDLTENLTVGQNFLENTDITGNRSIYWKTGGKMIREHTISGDRDILCDVKGSVVENFKRGVDLTENLMVGKDYVRDEKIDANKTVNNIINGSLNNKTIVRETETSFKRVNGNQTIKVVVDEYDEVLVIRNGKKKGGPKKGYYKYKNVKIGDEELLVLCRCNAECKK